MVQSQDKTESGFFSPEAPEAGESLPERPIDRFLEKIERLSIASPCLEAARGGKAVGHSRVTVTKVGF